MARRFAEWFAVHMSNFAFGWVWKEWCVWSFHLHNSLFNKTNKFRIPDLALSTRHPKRTFMRHAVELEVRLSYHDRILKTLPPGMQVPEAGVISELAPGPDYEYDDAGTFFGFHLRNKKIRLLTPTTGKPYHDAAQSILNLFRGRAKAEDVISHLDTLKSTLLESAAEDEGGVGVPVDVDTVARNIAVQSLLHVGARSFSHLLNAIERYLPLLRSIAGGESGGGAGGVGAVGKAEEAKMGILSAVARFWRGNRQMVGIVFDKFMQYQIVDPSEVVVWTFRHRDEGAGDDEEGRFLSGWEWELVRGALDKANGRVASARRKVVALRKEEDDARAREKAGFGVVVDVGMGMGGAMEVDGDAAAAKTGLSCFSIMFFFHSGNLYMVHRRSHCRKSRAHDRSQGVRDADEGAEDGAFACFGRVHLLSGRRRCESQGQGGDQGKCVVGSRELGKRRVEHVGDVGMV